MKTLFTSLILLTSSVIYSQYKYNNDYDYNSTIEQTWQISTTFTNQQISFSWEKDVVTSIIIKSLDNEFYLPKIDAFMTSQLTLNQLSSGRYEVIFLDDCDAIMYTKKFEIK